MKDSEINKIITIIQQKRKSDVKLDEQDEEVFRQFSKFIQDTVSKNLYTYQYGDILNDIKALETVNKLYSEVAGNMSKLTQYVSADSMTQMFNQFEYYTINEGVCVYDCQQVNFKQLELYNAKNIGMLHDLKIKRQFMPVNVQLVCGNLSGQLNYHRVVQNEKEKQILHTQQKICQHDDYINAIRIQQTKNATLIFSGDATGLIRISELQTKEGKIVAQIQTEILTQSALKDFVVIKTKQREARLVVMNAFGSVQIYDSTGQFLQSVNDEVQQYNTNQQSKIALKIQKLQLPGNSRMCTDPSKQFCYIGGYGGAVFCISPSGRVCQQFYIYDNQIQYGCFLSQIVYSQLGLVCSCNTIAQENKQILAGFVPAGAPRYQELPIILVGCSHVLQQRIFQNGNIHVIQGEGENKIDGQGEQQPEKSMHDTDIPVIKEDINMAVNNFLKYIKDQRSGQIKNE